MVNEKFENWYKYYSIYSLNITFNKLYNKMKQKATNYNIKSTK